MSAIPKSVQWERRQTRVGRFCDSQLPPELRRKVHQYHTLSEIDDDDYIIQLVAVGIGVLSVLVLAAIDYHKIARLRLVDSRGM